MARNLLGHRFDDDTFAFLAQLDKLETGKITPQVKADLLHQLDELAEAPLRGESTHSRQQRIRFLRHLVELRTNPDLFDEPR